MSSPFDLIIIGGGPAGLTAGLYAQRAGLKTVLLEKAGPGGLVCLADKIENFPGFPEGIKGFDLAEKIRQQTVGFGLEIKNEEVFGLTAAADGLKVTTNLAGYPGLAVILAVGSRPKTLNIPGEKEFTGKGVSYCAVCDGAFFKDKTVAVVGGGDSALEEAIYLAKLAKQVFIIHRRDRLRAADILQKRARQIASLNLLLNYQPREIAGTGKVDKIVLARVAGGPTEELAVDGVFISIGYQPATRFLKGLVDLDDQGFVLTDANMAASRPGIFAAGDCRHKPFRQVVIATGDGAVAALSAQRYLDEVKGQKYPGL